MCLHWTMLMLHMPSVEPCFRIAHTMSYLALGHVSSSFCCFQSLLQLLLWLLHYCKQPLLQLIYYCNYNYNYYAIIVAITTFAASLLLQHLQIFLNLYCVSLLLPHAPSIFITSTSLYVVLYCSFRAIATIVVLSTSNQLLLLSPLQAWYNLIYSYLSRSWFYWVLHLYWVWESVKISPTKFGDLLEPHLLLSMGISKPWILLSLRIFQNLLFYWVSEFLKPHFLVSLRISQNLTFYWVWESIKISYFFKFDDLSKPSILLSLEKFYLCSLYSSLWNKFDMIDIYVLTWEGMLNFLIN